MLLDDTPYLLQPVSSDDSDQPIPSAVNLIEVWEDELRQSVNDYLPSTKETGNIFIVCEFIDFYD